MKLMSTLLVASLLLVTAAPAMARHNNNAYVRSTNYGRAVQQQQIRRAYNPGAAANNRRAYNSGATDYNHRAFNQQRAANYVVQQQQAALVEQQRENQNNYGYYNTNQNYFGYPNYGYYGSSRSGILNSILR